jgi:glycosyltransferase involved in cell wall biosynthesis
MRAFEMLLLKHAWKVSTVTHSFVKQLENQGVDAAKITFLPNGADTDLLRPLPPSSSLLEKWGMQGKFVVLYVGTHAYYHGLETIVEAAGILRHREDIAFLMVGSGPERERIQLLADSPPSPRWPNCIQSLVYRSR